MYNFQKKRVRERYLLSLNSEKNAWIYSGKKKLKPIGSLKFSNPFSYAFGWKPPGIPNVQQESPFLLWHSVRFVDGLLIPGAKAVSNATPVEAPFPLLDEDKEEDDEPYGRLLLEIGASLALFLESMIMAERRVKWTVRVILHLIDFTCRVHGSRTEIGEPKKDILYYFAFRLSIANTLIHGLLKKPSPTPSLAEDENDEPPPKRRVTTCIPHQAAHNNEARDMPEMVGDRNHRSRCRNEKCSALTTVQCTD
ncbi:DDE_Tnp_1_7 domain-containing protein [Trichonephila inaurata madagascariensis]|uniref:DDE_Tnp_1_7 domain-containing protein n=1 Tax=Trichonephila inaurata madagascariensis TaxID=2747483 RepID=A0A8X6MIG2_9ARAC|nr:DDE_Tnp_1_7 domain-containing protein [Trichonephila inaurata madagascariensis]